MAQARKNCPLHKTERGLEKTT